MNVVVIGAGLAGLNAAVNLEDQGAAVLLLEAQPRPGGRLRTLRTADGALECGATTVGPEYGRIRALADRFTVPLVKPQGFSGMAWHIHDKLGKPGTWESAPQNRTVGFERSIGPAVLEPAAIKRFTKLASAADWRDPAFAKWDIPADRFYRECGLSDEAIRLIEITSNCESLATTSALFQMKEIQSIATWGRAGGQANSVYDAGNDSHSIGGGSDRLPEAIARGLKSEVQYSTPVTSIDMNARGCEVRTAAGQRIACDYVVSAIPFSALSRIMISPVPTGVRGESIHKSLYMGTSHFFFAVTKPYWEQDGADPGMITDGSIERVFANRDAGGEATLLDVWINGAGVRAFDRMDRNAAVVAVTAELYRLRPSMRGAIRFIESYSWGNNPFVTGNKHIFQPGQVTRFAAQMAEPWHRLHFAGEHTRDIEPGMEAAAATGERAAFEILAKLGIA